MEVCLLDLSPLDPQSSIILMGTICAYVLERQLALIAHMFSSQALMSVYGKRVPEEKQKILYAT